MLIRCTLETGPPRSDSHTAHCPNSPDTAHHAGQPRRSSGQKSGGLPSNDNTASEPGLIQKCSFSGFLLFYVGETRRSLIDVEGCPLTVPALLLLKREEGGPDG